jgi:hypothetical protein
VSEQGLTFGIGQWWDQRDLPLGQLKSKMMFLVNRRIAPAAGSLKFNDDSFVVIQANSVDPVFVTVHD